MIFVNLKRRQLVRDRELVVETGSVRWIVLLIRGTLRTGAPIVTLLLWKEKTTLFAEMT